MTTLIRHSRITIDVKVTLPIPGGGMEGGGAGALGPGGGGAIGPGGGGGGGPPLISIVGGGPINKIKNSCHEARNFRIGSWQVSKV